MTTIADITVKKADGTTNILWSAITGSGGDKSPALWRSNSTVGTVGQKPWFQVVTNSNQGKTGRRVSISAQYPMVYTDTTTTLTQIRDKGTFSGDFFVPGNLDAVNAGEFAAQIANLIASAMVVGSITSGYAPT